MALAIGFAIQEFAGACGRRLFGIATAIAFATYGFRQARHTAFHNKVLLVWLTTEFQHSVDWRSQRLALKKLLQTSFWILENTIRINAVQY